MTTVLVVDDEAGFRSTLVRLLRKRGFETLEADCAETALVQIRNPGAKVELILLDVILPNMSGLELAKRVEEGNINLKILFMSGYPLNILKRNFGISKNLLPLFLL